MVTIPTTANVTRPVAEGYGALLSYGADAGEDIYLPLAVGPDTPIQREPAPDDGEAPATDQNPQDFDPQAGRVFSRTQFSGGEGLDFAHRPDANPLDSSRFWASSGISVRPSVPGTPERLRLQRENEAIPNTSTTETTIFMVRVPESTRIFWIDTNEVKYHDNLLTATPTPTAENPGTASGGASRAVLDLALLGRTLYAALTTDGVAQRVWAGTWTAWSAQHCDRIWGVKGRVIGSSANVLYEVAAGAGSTALKTLTSTTDTWLSVIDAGSVILAAASDGKIYGFAVESASLVLKTEFDLQIGEVAYDMAYANGLVFLGTGEANTSSGVTGRLYVAQIVALTLRGARLIREFGVTAVNTCPSGFLVTRDAVLFGVTDASEKNIWRYHLATAGMTHELELDHATGLVRDLAMLDGRLIVASDTHGLYREKVTFETTGWMIFPLADFYSAAIKSWVGLMLTSETIASMTGATITLKYTTDPAGIEDPAHSSWVAGISLTAAGTAVLTTEQSLREVEGRYMALQVVIGAPTAKTSTPEVLAVAARGFFQRGDVLITVPVNLSDMLSRPGKMPLLLPGLGNTLLDALIAREKKPADLTVLGTSEQIRGRVERVAVQTAAVSPRGSLGQVAFVTVRGQEM